MEPILAVQRKFPQNQGNGLVYMRLHLVHELYKSPNYDLLSEIKRLTKPISFIDGEKLHNPAEFYKMINGVDLVKLSNDDRKHIFVLDEYYQQFLKNGDNRDKTRLDDVKTALTKEKLNT